MMREDHYKDDHEGESRECEICERPLTSCFGHDVSEVGERNTEPTRENTAKGQAINLLNDAVINAYYEEWLLRQHPFCEASKMCMGESVRIVNLGQPEQFAVCERHRCGPLAEDCETEANPLDGESSTFPADSIDY